MGFRTRKRERALNKRKNPNESKAEFAKRAPKKEGK